MKRKILWMGLSLLVVAALVLTSCAKEEVVTPGEQEEEEEQVVGKPIYGGTLTWISCATIYPPNSWDILSGEWWNNHWTAPYMSHLLAGDIEKYGPRGTNVYDFNSCGDMPEEYLSGDLAETWEVTAEALTFHLRHGIMWSGNTRIGMEPRELTADDVVFSLNRLAESPLCQSSSYVKDIYAEDRYTVVIDLNYYDLNWGMWLGGGALTGIYPPEVVEAGFDNWQNQVSCGPFILTNWVEGSYASYERNPGYFKTTTINGKEYDIPFVDELVYPVLLDEITQVAILRTGKAEGADKIGMKYVDNLTDTCPDLEIHTYGYGRSVSNQLKLNCETGIFTDMDIRRAMMIGTDLNAIARSVYGEADIHLAFSYGSPAYTPIDELPTETKMLFTYDPTLARQMLADAGHPDGFTTVVHADGALSDHMDMASMLVEQWAKIGVTLNLDVMETTAHTSLKFVASEGGFLCQDGTAASNELPERMTGNTMNSSRWSNAYFDEQVTKELKMTDPVARSAIQKEMCILFVNEASQIPMPSPRVACLWWPWIKNYYGETDCYWLNFTPIVSRMWIDQDMKAEMGY